MIPDIFQYFLDTFWKFQSFCQTLTFSPLFHHQNISKNIGKDGKIFKVCFHISTFRNSKIPHKMDTTRHQVFAMYFSKEMFKFWWSKNNWSVRTFEIKLEKYDGGILVNFEYS